MKKKISSLVCGSLLLTSFSAMAGDMMVRTRAINVMPEESGKAAGGDVTVGNDSVPEIDFTYFFNNNFALELIAATTTHAVGVKNSALDGINLGNVSLLPPTLSAQYHHEMGNFKPYVGAGLNYTMFYGAESGDTRVKTVTYENALGYSLQVGADYKVAENLYINFDVKKLTLSTDVTVKTYAGTTVESEVDLDPYVIGLGVGLKF